MLQAHSAWLSVSERFIINHMHIRQLRQYAQLGSAAYCALLDVNSNMLLCSPMYNINKFVYFTSDTATCMITRIAV